MTAEADFNRAKDGVERWNAWAEKEREKKPPLRAPVDLTDRDLSNISFEGFIFPSRADFGRSQWTLNTARFNDAVFDADVTFEACQQPLGTTFRRAEFNQAANFKRVAFSSASPLIDFRQTQFRGRTDFSNCTFGSPLDFSDSRFLDELLFAHSWFSGDTNFANARVSGVATFSGCNFWRTSFGGMHFEAHSYFQKCVFRDVVSFDDVVFGNDTQFTGAQFEGNATFFASRFLGRSTYDGATFAKNANFKNAHFVRIARFNNSSFTNTTGFEGIVFENPPEFHNATLHQDTSFSRGENIWKQFPDVASDGAENAYRTLKLAMSHVQSNREERVFFALEMRARSRHEPWHRKWLYQTYDLISLYGHSLLRPFVALLVAFLGFGLVYEQFNYYNHAVSFEMEPWYLSAARTIPIPGLFPSENTAAAYVFGSGIRLSGDVWAAAQRLLSAVLIFLFLLAVRNRFRIH